MENNLLGKKILIIGGDLLSVDIVKTAQSMGLYTIVTDWYDTNRSPAKLIADEYWNVSVEAYDELADKIHQHHIDGVLTGFTDSYLSHYHQICERAGLPCYGTLQQFLLLTDKTRYKELCLQFGVPTIPTYRETDSNITFPVIVKPVDGSGSRGISICQTREQMLAAIQEAQSLSKQHQYLIEQYIEGREVTIFWLLENGKYHLAAMGNRHVKYFNSAQIPLPVGYTFPSVFIEKYQEEIEEKAKQMFRHIGLQNGMLFMQCKVQNGTCFVYDIGFRLTGSLEYKILEQVCGYNPLKMLIHYAITGKMSEKPIESLIQPRFEKPAFNVSCLCEPGTIAAIEGIESVQHNHHVLDLQINHQVGDTITEAMRGRLAQITVRVLGEVSKISELLPTMNWIEEQIRVTSIDGKNMRMPGIMNEDIEGYVL